MSARSPIGSVLIPAHNEAAVIGRCLHHLFEGTDAGDLEVAVVCNGCDDDTAAVARAADHPIEVVELDEASKPAALRAGDRLLHTFPRLYLDADVVLPGSTARQLLEHLARNSAVAARPPFRYDAAHSTAIVQRYFRARSRMPTVMGSIWGAGVYGLSATGRARFEDHPDVVAEDLFVHQQFDPDEIEIVGDEPVVVIAPARFRDLLMVRRRAYRGVVENRAAADESKRQERRSYRPATTASTVRDMLRLCRSLPGVLDAATYAFVAVSARLYNAFGATARWERDESSRSIASVGRRS
jgi:glycosyltransferase involved in cell wall biosynthesis